MTRTSANDTVTTNRPASENRRLTKVVGVRLSDEELERYTTVAKARNMSVQDLMRACTDYVLDLSEREQVARHDIGT